MHISREEMLGHTCVYMKGRITLKEANIAAFRPKGSRFRILVGVTTLNMAQDDLTGHTIGGIVSVSIGLWWMCNALRQYYLAKLLQSPKYKYRNTATYPCPCAPTKQIEGWIKALLSFVGIFNELNWGDPNHNILTGKHVQHSMLWTFFCFSGVVDLLTHHFPRMMPQNLDDISLALAIFMKYWIFTNHTHGKDLFQNSIHGFLLPLDLGAAAATLLGIVWKDSVIPPFVRGVMFIVAGTWVAQVGWILYPPSGVMTWDRNDHDQLMLVAGLFTLHFAFALFFSLLVLVFIYWRMNTIDKGLSLSVVIGGLDPNLVETRIENGFDNSNASAILAKMQHIN